MNIFQYLSRLLLTTMSTAMCINSALIKCCSSTESSGLKAETLVHCREYVQKKKINECQYILLKW